LIFSLMNPKIVNEGTPHCMFVIANYLHCFGKVFLNCLAAFMDVTASFSSEPGHFL
jgi:hypothetical protein